MHPLSIPAADMAEFAALPEAARDEVNQWLEIIRSINSAPRPLEECALHARRYAGRRGFSRANIIRKFYAWRQSHDWRVFVDHAACPRAQSAKLPPEFIDFWKSLCESNQRKSRSAWRKLIQLWHHSKIQPIPGYPCVGASQTVSPPPAAGGIPAGWSYANLMRYAPSDFELSVARIGRVAAAQYRPLVFTSRVGLQCGQFYVIDDLEHDVKINFLGVNTRAMRPLELCCLDLFSGCKIAWGMKPTIDDDGVKEKLKEREMRSLLAYILTRIGYRPEGTTICAEHGVAAIRPEIEKIIRDASDGAITVNRAGLSGAAALVYEGRSKGNFRFKAALESHHNLTHNELADLPGQMGKDRDHSPEELHGRERHNNALIRAIRYLPPDRAALLNLPFLEFGVFLDIARLVYDRINQRDWHNLEGWLEARLVAHEFRLGPDLPWLPTEQLARAPAHEVAAIRALLEQPGYTRIRKLSPQEVWNAGRNKLVRLPGHFAPLIIGTDCAVERRVNDNGMIEFQDRELGPGIFRFLARVRAPTGEEFQLPAGEKILAYCNPYAMDTLYVCKAGVGAGAYLGECPRWQSIRRDDVEALQRQMGAAVKAEYALLRPYQARHTADLRARAAAARQNAAVLSGARITAQEKIVDDTIGAASVRAADRAAALQSGRPDAPETKEFSADEIADILRSDQNGE